MGFINKTSATTIKARLTAQGTKYLLTEPTRFNITQFGLADDEIDYSLYNEAHENGSDYFGEVLENMPVLEPISNSHLQCRFWLLTGVATGTIRVPGFLFSPSTVHLPYADTEEPLRITMINADEGNARIRYKVFDSSLFELNVHGGNHTLDDISGNANGNSDSDANPAITPIQGSFDLASARLTLTPKRWDDYDDITGLIEFTHVQSNNMASLEVVVSRNTSYTGG